jgi:hypothetical protein
MNRPPDVGWHRHPPHKESGSSQIPERPLRRSPYRYCDPGKIHDPTPGPGLIPLRGDPLKREGRKVARNPPPVLISIPHEDPACLSNAASTRPLAFWSALQAQSGTPLGQRALRDVQRLGDLVVRPAQPVQTLELFLELCVELRCVHANGGGSPHLIPNYRTTESFL